MRAFAWQDEVEVLLGKWESFAPSWQPEMCLVEYAPALAAALQDRIARAMRSPSPPPPAQLHAMQEPPASGSNGEGFDPNQHGAPSRPTLWNWLERGAGAARAAGAAAGAALDATLTDAKELSQAIRHPPPMAQHAGAGGITTLVAGPPVEPPPPSLVQQPQLSRPPQAPAPGAATLHPRAELWAALSEALGAPLETDGAASAEQQSCAFYMMSSAHGEPLLLEVSFPREAFPELPPSMALSPLGGAAGSAGGVTATPPARRPDAREMAWSASWDARHMADALAEYAHARAAAWSDDPAPSSPLHSFTTVPVD